MFICVFNVLLFYGAYTYIDVSIQEKNDLNKRVNFAEENNGLLREVIEDDKRNWVEKFCSTMVRKTDLPWKPFPGMPRKQALKQFGNESCKFLLNKSRSIKQSNMDPTVGEPRLSLKLAGDSGLLQYQGTGSCKPISSDLVLYNRIFKTGCETTGSIFKLVASMMDYEYAKSR